MGRQLFNLNVQATKEQGSIQKTFTYLCSIVAHSLKKSDSHMRACIPVETHACSYSTRSIRKW